MLLWSSGLGLLVEQDPSTGASTSDGAATLTGVCSCAGSFDGEPRPRPFFIGDGDARALSDTEFDGTVPKPFNKNTKSEGVREWLRIAPDEERLVKKRDELEQAAADAAEDDESEHDEHESDSEDDP